MQSIKRAHNFGTYFITANCAEKRRVFQTDRSARLMYDTLQHYRPNYKLHAFVIMPDHIHLLLTPGDVTLERCLQLIKGSYSRRYKQGAGAHSTIWQKGSNDHRCRDREDYLKHLRYIEQNPVVAGFVTKAEDYQWSSASRSLREGIPSAAEAAHDDEP